MSEPFNNEFVQAGVNIQQTAATFMQFMTSVLKPYKLTFQQYNVLRILSKTYPTSVSISVISSQMIDPNSNASRLVDKLCSKELTERAADNVDKRKVLISITEAGLKMAQETTLLLENELTEKMKALTEAEVKQLNEWLSKLS